MTGPRQPDPNILTDLAYRALRDLTIEVQSSFLTLAGRDDGSINFDNCLDSAIGARLRAVNILNDLYLRQSKKARARSNTNSDASVSQRSSVTNQVHEMPTTSPEMLQMCSDEMKEVVEISPMRPSVKRSATIESKSSGKPASERSAGSIRGLSRKSSWSVFKILHRSPSVEQHGDLVSPLSPQKAGLDPAFPSPALSPQTLAMYSPAVGPASVASTQIMTPPISPISPLSSIDVLAAASFCKGAYYIQQGILNKGLSLSAKNMEWACHCRKCPFAIPADTQHGRPRFDDRAKSTLKLRWRSLLLFKSHLATSQKKKRVYKCLICVLQGIQVPTFESEHDMFEHMITHQGGVSNGIELWGPLSLEPTGVRVATETTFDVCFAENPRFALPESAFEMSIATEVFEADGRELVREDAL